MDVQNGDMPAVDDDQDSTVGIAPSGSAEGVDVTEPVSTVDEVEEVSSHSVSEDAPPTSLDRPSDAEIIAQENKIR